MGHYLIKDVGEGLYIVYLGFSHHASVQPIYKGALVKYKDIHASFSEASK
jgi:hypothetical protein